MLANTLTELSRRKVFRALAMYVMAALALTEAADVAMGQFPNLPGWTVRAVIIAALAGLPLVAVFAWVFDITVHGVKRTKDLPASAVLDDDYTKKLARGRRIDFVVIGALVALVVVLWLKDPDTVATQQTKSIAVLPFENWSNDPANAYFSDGLSEELLNVLAQVDGLRVAARTSAFQFRDKSIDIRKIGESLNVETVLEGTVRMSGNRVRITAQLINVEDGFHLWSKSYDRELTDIFAVQDQIARAVVDALQVELLGEETQLALAPTENFEAYTLYLKGRNEWHKRKSRALERALGYFHAAIALDPDYALAYTGLADTYNYMSTYGNMSLQESAKRSEDAAVKALKLDDNLAEAHASMGLVQMDKQDWTTAAAEFQRAIELRPSYAMAHMWYGSVLSITNPEAALVQREKARQLDPYSPIIHITFGRSLMRVGRVDEAIASYETAVTLDPTFPAAYRELAQIAIQKNEWAEAIDWLHRAIDADPGHAGSLAQMGFAYQSLGAVETADEWFVSSRLRHRPTARNRTE